MLLTGAHHTLQVGKSQSTFCERAMGTFSEYSQYDGCKAPMYIQSLEF